MKPQLFAKQIMYEEENFGRKKKKTKKKKTLEELEIIPICSKKRVCEKIVLEEFLKFMQRLG